MKTYSCDSRVKNYKNGGCSDEYYTPDSYFNDALKDFNKCFNLDISLDQCDVNSTFYFGGDYAKKEYDSKKIILDNPPFSKLREIINFFNERKIKFILFFSNCCFIYDHICRKG